MNDFELTDDKRSELRMTVTRLDPVPSADRDIAMIRYGEEAAQRKLVEWGDEICEDESHVAIVTNIRRHQCHMCWQELRKGVGLE